MACAPATRRLTYWTYASALALVALAVTATAARAAETDARTILIFPLQSHWLSEPLARKVDRALVSALSQAGFTATTAAPSAVRPQAIEDGWVLPEDLQEPDRPGARHALTAATGLIASLRGDLFASPRCARIFWRRACGWATSRCWPDARSRRRRPFSRPPLSSRPMSAPWRDSPAPPAPGSSRIGHRSCMAAW